MAMPFDFEIEQMMARGSAHRGLELTREDKSLVSKMIGGSVTTLDANLVEKMIDGSVETNNARIVEQMLAGSQRSPDEDPPLDYCLPALSSSSRSKTNGDYKESKSTNHGAAPRRIYVDDVKGSDDKGHHEVVANATTFPTEQHPINTLSSAMPKHDRTDNDDMGIQELPTVNTMGSTTWELWTNTEMTKRPSVSNPETRRNSPPPPKVRNNRHTLPTKPLEAMVSSSLKYEGFDVNKRRTSKARRESTGGRESRASFPSYDGHEVPNDNDILAKMLGGSVNKR